MAKIYIRYAKSPKDFLQKFRELWSKEYECHTIRHTHYRTSAKLYIRLCKYCLVNKKILLKYPEIRREILEEVERKQILRSTQIKHHGDDGLLFDEIGSLLEKLRLEITHYMPHEEGYVK